MRPSLLADITPSSLQQGHGERVCEFLNLLCDAASERVKHEWRDFVYPSPVTASVETPPDDEDEEDIMEVGRGGGEHWDCLLCV